MNLNIFDTKKVMLLKKKDEENGNWMVKGIIVGYQHPCYLMIKEILDKYKEENRWTISK